MGRNSKQRRDARRRTDPPGSGRPRANPFQSAGFGAGHPSRPGGDDPERAALLVHTELRGLSPTANRPAVRRRVDALVQRASPIPAAVVQDALHALLRSTLSSVIGIGWSPDDLHEIVTRRCSADLLPLLVPLLSADAATPPAPSPAWSDRVDALAAGVPARARAPITAETLTDDLWLARLLTSLPGLPPMLDRVAASGAGAGAGARGHARGVPAAPIEDVPDELGRKLATVRALLAKAESTTFDEEAEALTSKAQELISRYSLERLLEQGAAASGGAAGADHVDAVRIWLDSPYADAKASLVHCVSEANRCKAVFSADLGCCTVVGDPGDLASIELLVTSLLVQASRAMVRHGAQVDAHGVSRTRSFRAAFLMSYAVRIGQRLQESAEQAVADAVALEDRGSRLLPALRSHEVAVQETFDELVGTTTSRAVTISNGAGWAAGKVAADQAKLDVRQRLSGGSS